MSDLDYDALTGDWALIEAFVCGCNDDDCPRREVVRRVAQRAEADRAAVERVTALADEWERRGSILPANQLGKPHAPAMKQAVDRLRAALDREEDQ